jgi:L-rhamnose isomerase/sugar isomerase
MTVRITTEQILDIEGDSLPAHERDVAAVSERLTDQGVDTEAVIREVARFSVAAPSWAVGTGGTRFGRFPAGGEPRTTEEKVDDVAALNALTGANRTISLHVPWDDPRDPGALRAHARDGGITFDAMNSNTFQDNPSTTGDGAVSYKFGSFAHADPDVRKQALAHNLAVVDLGVQLGATAITVWLADGTNSPGKRASAASSNASPRGSASCMTRFRPTGSSTPSTSPTSQPCIRASTPTGEPHSCSRNMPAHGRSASSTSVTICPTPTSNK